MKSKRNIKLSTLLIQRDSATFITAQSPLNDTNGDKTLSSKQFWKTSSKSLLNPDVNWYECPSTLFKSKIPNETNAEMYRWRPDIIILERNCITVKELSCPFETNLLKSHDYKITKYQNLGNALLNPCSHFILKLLEFSSSLGFTGTSIKILNLLKWKTLIL